MYTFIIAAVFSFILAGAIFGKRIKQNQMTVAMIVFAGTLLASVIANGVLGKDIPYTMVKTKTKTLGAHHSIVKELNDTIFDRYTDIQYVYNRKLKKNGDTILSHYINLGGSYDEFYHSSDRSRKLTIELMEKGDSTEAYVDVYRLKKLPNSKWVSKLGLPMGGREFHVYLENCSRDSFMLEQINERFYGIEPPVQIVNMDSTENIYADVISFNESN